MFTPEQMLYLLVASILSIFLLRLFQLERKWDAWCFVIGYYVIVSFSYLVLFSLLIGKFDLIPDLISSLVIALLTLALVWVELSKRPELKLLDFIPIIHDLQTTAVYKAGYHNSKLSEPSRFLKIREASYEDSKFDEHFSFAVDLSNIGYGEIMVHEYVFYIDGKKQSPIPLGTQPDVERLRLIAQQRHTIDMPSLYIENTGFHKIRFEVIATTVKRSREVWFFISEDFKKLRYVEMYPLKRLLSRLIKNELKDP